MGIWIAPAVLLSAYVIYQSQKRDWRLEDPSTGIRLRRWRVRQGLGPAAALVPIRRKRRHMGVARHGMRSGNSFPKGNIFPTAEGPAAASLSRVVPQQCTVSRYVPEQGSQARISLLVVDGSGTCSTGEWTAYLN